MGAMESDYIEGWSLGVDTKVSEAGNDFSVMCLQSHGLSLFEARTPVPSRSTFPVQFNSSLSLPTLNSSFMYGLTVTHFI